MKKIKLLKAVSTVMMVVTLVTSMGATNVLAAEVDNTPSAIETDGDIETRAGVETLPLNRWYTISSGFSIDGYNYTPCKTSTGQYLTLKFKCKVSNQSIGNSGVHVKILIRDYNTREFISSAGFSFSLENQNMTYNIETAPMNLGYSNRKIQIYTQITSFSSSDSSERTVDFWDYQSYTNN